jgi:hypothetical protein
MQGTDAPPAAESQVAQGWRDRIKVHRVAKDYPMMSDAELDALAKDIEANGLRNGITLWTPAKRNEIGRQKRTEEDLFGWADRKKFDLYLIDGRNRLAGIERIADVEERDNWLSEAFSLRDHFDVSSATFLDGDELNEGGVATYVASLNLHRRHLTAEQKRERIEALLRARPERSDRSIAKEIEASPTYVGKIRAEAEEAGTVSTVDTRTGADGVVQPAHKPATPKPAAPQPAAKVVEPRPAATPAPEPQEPVANVVPLRPAATTPTPAPASVPHEPEPEMFKALTKAKRAAEALGPSGWYLFWNWAVEQNEKRGGEPGGGV